MNNSSSERLTSLVQELDDPVMGAFLVKSIGHSETLIRKAARARRRTYSSCTSAIDGLSRATLNEDATDILTSIDQLLYALMDLGGDEAWKDEGEFEQRTQLKLGEALKDRMILAKAIKI